MSFGVEQLALLAAVNDADAVRRLIESRRWERCGPRTILALAARDKWVVISHLLRNQASNAEAVLAGALNQIDRSEDPVAEVGAMVANRSIVPAAMAACLRRRKVQLDSQPRARCGFHPYMGIFEVLAGLGFLSGDLNDDQIQRVLGELVDGLLKSSPGVHEVEPVLYVLGGEPFRRALKWACQVGTASDLFEIWRNIHDRELPGCTYENWLYLKERFPDTRFAWGN